MNCKLARRAWDLARRAWADFGKGFLLRRDGPVGGCDVSVGGRPPARQVDPTTFLLRDGFYPEVAARLFQAVQGFLPPFKRTSIKFEVFL